MAAPRKARTVPFDRRTMGMGLARALRSARTPEEFLLSPAFQGIDLRRMLLLELKPRAARLSRLSAKGAAATEAERREMEDLRKEAAEIVAKANKLRSLQITARRMSLVGLAGGPSRWLRADP